jgi:cell division protein FtsN
MCAAYEKATREQRIRNDMMQSKQEEEFYLDKVRQGQGIEAMEKKKLKRAQEADEADDAVASFLAPRRPLDDADPAPVIKKARKAAPVAAQTAPGDDKVLRTFRQSTLFLFCCARIFIC